MMIYEERIEKDYKKALEGGKEMLEKSQELLFKGCELIENNLADSDEYKEGMRLLAEAQLLSSYYDKMFY